MNELVIATVVSILFAVIFLAFLFAIVRKVEEAK